MNAIKPVGIADFSLITALGSDHQSQLDNALAGSLSGMVADTKLLRGQQTFVGRIASDLVELAPVLSDFNYRANRLLMSTLAPLEQVIEAQKSRYSLSRIGVIMATSTSGVDSLECALPHFDQSGEWLTTYRAHHQRMGSISEFVARYLAVTGPVMTVSTACSSGNKALAAAKRWLNADICDVVICGGVDVLTELTLRGFDALGALSYAHSLPFSKNRSGINIGEASAVFVLTQDEQAINLLGTGESSDAHHISAPDPDGNGAANAMQQALTMANIAPQAIDYINLHGTGTAQNDAMESTAIHRVFADYADCVPCSSTKPQIGHTLGVSGLAELGLTLLSMTGDNATCLPHVYDGQFDEHLAPMNLVSTAGTTSAPKTVLSNSFAFGGSNASIIVGKT